MPDEIAKAFLCLDCGVDTSGVTGIDEYYMVHNEIWDSVEDSRGGMLCFSCLEKRIGRQLTPGDLTQAPINHLLNNFEKLNKRL